MDAAQPPTGFDSFTAETLRGKATTFFARCGGNGPPLLLLHGFPETHLMWRAVAPRLAQGFTVICADLPGYGQSNCPASDPWHAAYSKRAMAEDLLMMMERLGFDRFHVAGHDRGGRVAYRLALDHPARVRSATVLDVVPTEAMWARVDAEVALGFWPWSLLAQPAPLPERILENAAGAIVDHALEQWGSTKTIFPREVRRAYAEALQSEEHARAVCEEYRAAATIDREHDRADCEAGRRITCPLLALWSARGPLERWFADAGGPLGVWRQWADRVEGHPIAGGHFFPEEAPAETAEALSDFLNRHS